MSGALPSVPSFSEQQVHDLINIIHLVMQQYFAPHDQPPSTPSAPQEAQKEEDEQLLQQAFVKKDAENTVESITESTMKHDSKSNFSTIPRLCIARSSGDSAACPSNTLLLARLLGYTQFGYIRHSEGIEKTGQG